MNRREFLTNSLLSGMALSTSSPLFSGVAKNLTYKNEHRDLLKLLDKSKNSSQFLTMSGVDPTIDFIHTKSNDGDASAPRPGVAFFNDNMESAIVDVPLFPHSIEQNPNNLSRIMLIPKKRFKCVEFDVVQNKVVAELTLKDKKFYGHGCYIPGTDLFYTSTFSYDSSATSMVLFDIKAKKIVKDVLIEGAAGAHQCSLSHDKKYIIMTFSKGTKTHKPSVAWFDVNTGELVNRVYGMREHAEHFADLNDGYLIFTGGLQFSKAPTVLGSLSPDKKVSNFVFENDKHPHFTGYSVSICGLESKNLAFMANVIENSIYVLNYKTGALIKRIDISAPRGMNLSNDGKHLIVTTISNFNNKDARVSLLDIETMEIVKQFKIDHALAYSSHTTKYMLG